MNIFEIFLQSLGVPYTPTYTAQRYMTHPHRDNLLGLWQLSRDYGIHTQGVTIANRSIEEVSLPSILHLSDHFVVLTDWDEQYAYYTDTHTPHRVTLQELKSQWSGSALIVTDDKDACEPQYEIHQRKERIRLMQQGGSLAAIVLLVGGLLLRLLLQGNMLLALWSILDLMGIVVCFFLLQKQVRSHSHWGDKVCSLFHQKDCNAVLHSDHAQWGGFTWSEIGGAYFVVHLCWSFTAIPSAISILSVIGVVTLLFSVWSVWYQAFVVRQWCVLCLFVQVVILLQFLAGCFFSTASLFPTPNFIHLLATGGAWLLCLLPATYVAHWVAAHWSAEVQAQSTAHSYASLKFDSSVCRHLLHQGVPATELASSTILLGNSKATIRLTVLTNPHCNPCARLHPILDDLLERQGKTVCLQYVFCSFNETLLPSVRLLIAAYQQCDAQTARRIFADWYAEGKNDTAAFEKRYPYLNIESEAVESELNRHLQWRETSGYTSTPTILINGYPLPQAYQWEDLADFIDALSE